jgi:hypothetical protein
MSLTRSTTPILSHVSKSVRITLIYTHHSERNRLHAKKSRLRKKSLTGTLHDSLAALKEDNAKLRELIYAKIGEQATNDMLEQRIIDSHNKFIAGFTGGLENNNKRVVDTKTLSFLKGLRKNVQKTTTKKSISSPGGNV